MNQYCVVCDENEVEQLYDLLKEKGYTVFYPKAERHFRVQQRDVLAVKPLIKGAIFIEYQAGIEDLAKMLKKFKTFHVTYIKRFSEDVYHALVDLMDENQIVRMSTGISENRMPVVMDGPLKGNEDIIRKTNRHKRLAELNIPINGKSILVGLEIKEKR